MNILQKIVQQKQKDLQLYLKDFSPQLIHRQTNDDYQPLNFKKALQAPGLSLIAEIKKASPSKGIICHEFHPLEIAQTYVKNKATCLSVITEQNFFEGHPKFIKMIRNEVNLPILRKDFIIDECQIRESYDLKADAILLIAAILTPQQLKSFRVLADEFGLYYLVEVHNLDELSLVLDLGFDLIGINNRNLKSFQTDINNSITLKKMIPPGIITVSESGIKTSDDCQLLYQNNFDAILVGEALLKNNNPSQSINDLFNSKFF